MGEVDKPFGCPQPGCGMRFTNEDHLTVHRRRHEMELRVSGTHGAPGDHHTPSLIKHHGFLIDQTPTPTRFLRQCEEIGLFQEISLNPFDEQFRRASLLRSNNSVIDSSNCESLNTPRIALVECDHTITSTSRDIPQDSAELDSSTPIPHLRSGESLKEENGRLCLNVASAAEEAAQNTTSVISTPTPVITAGPSVTQSLSLSEGSAKSSVTSDANTMVANTMGMQYTSDSSPGNVPETPGSICAASQSGAQPGVPPSPSATVLQLLLRLPNGQAIPVEIPATPIASSCPSNTTDAAPTSASSVLTSPSHPQSLAKMRLKQALASSNTAARPGGSRTRANTADRIAEMTRFPDRPRHRSGSERHRHISGTSTEADEADEDLDIHGSTSICGRRRHGSEDDPAEKRKKFLERNRAAAIRCREKKKKWIENLALKYDELGSTNQKLQSEVSSLRSEVATLKSMLLRHKDCPVTLAMQGDNYIDGVNHDGGGGMCDANHYTITCPPSPTKHRTRSLSLPSIPLRDENMSVSSSSKAAHIFIPGSSGSSGSSQLPSPPPVRMRHGSDIVPKTLVISASPNVIVATPMVTQMVTSVTPMTSVTPQYLHASTTTTTTATTTTTTIYKNKYS